MAAASRGVPLDPATLPELRPLREPQVAAPPQPTQLAQTLGRQFVVTVEMHPPCGIDALEIVQHAEDLKQAGANILNIADSPLARMRMSPWACAFLIQQQVGIETILHFPTRGRNLLAHSGRLAGLPRAQRPQPLRGDGRSAAYRRLP